MSDSVINRRDPVTGQLAYKVAGVPLFSETPGVMFASRTASAGVEVTEDTALNLSAVFAGVNRLANVAAMLPIGVYRKDSGGKRTQLDTHPAQSVLRTASNPNQTAFVARHFMQFWKPIWGAACAEIEWDGAARPRAIWPLGPWRVRPVYMDDGSLAYQIDGKRVVHQSDMIYVPHVTEDGVTGRGFVHFALESLGVALAADNAAGTFFGNDMRPGGLLVHPGNPPKEARREFREEWSRNHGGPSNRGKTGVLWGGWTFVNQAGALAPEQAQLLESRKYSVEEVSRWLNVPPHWLSQLDRATYSNIEQQGLDALVYTVGPGLEATEQEYDRKLLNPPTVYCRHNVNALLRADMKTRAEFYSILRGLGVLDADEIRELEDLNPIGKPEGGARRFVPVNWQPLDAPVVQQQPGATPGAPPATPAAPAGKPPAPGATPPQLRLAARDLVGDSLGWWLRKELMDARRAAKEPRKLFAWADDFYPRLRESMGKALASAAAVAKLAEPAFPDADALAEAWVGASREAILSASECQPHEWPARSEQLFREWESARIPSVLESLLGGDHAAN